MTARSDEEGAAIAGVALRLHGLSKTFPGQRALDDVDLEIAAGEIHALVGQNGSGKSTVVKILAGYHQPDDGAVAEVADVPFELGLGDRSQRRPDCASSTRTSASSSR